MIHGTSQHVTLPRRPSQLRIIAALEIAVRDAHGAFLLVVYPDYSGAESDFPAGTGTTRFAIASSEPGEWTPPYRTYNVDRILSTAGKRRPSQLPCETKKLFEYFDQAWHLSNPLEDLYDTAEGLGLRSTEIQQGEIFHVFRPSYRHPEDYRGYRVVRFRGQIQEDDFLNIADPEMRKGLGFLPIDDLYSSLPERDCPNHGRPERLFLGRPIAHNLREILESASDRDAIVHDAVEVGEERFFSAEEGFVFAGDLAGYGRCCQFASAEGGGLGLSGDVVSQRLRNAATHAFTRLFLSSGVYQTHTAGDGFLCAIPREEIDSDPGRLEQFLVHYCDLVQELETTNAEIRALGEYRQISEVPQLGSRLAVHYGPYRFGKMSLFGSLLPTFDGASIIQAARLEGGLRSWIGDQDHPVGRHTAVVSEPAKDVLSGELPTTWNLHTENATMGAKEFSGSGNVYCLCTSSQPGVSDHPGRAESLE